MKRIFWVDAIKGIAMLLVIFSHCENVLELAKFVYEPFFLTSFFFVSGYLFHNPEKQFSFKRKAIRIIETLIIPYVLYWAISFFVDKFLHGQSLHITLIEFCNVLVYGRKLWFVSCLVVTELAMLIFMAINHAPKFIICTSILLLGIYLVTPLSSMPSMAWYVNNGFVAFFYMGVGYFFRSKEKSVLGIINKWGGQIVFIYILLVTINYLWLGYRFSFPGNDFSSIYFFLLSSIIGIVGLYWICNKLKENKIISFVGMYSLLFYFYQHQVILALGKLYHSYMTFIPYSSWSFIEALLTTAILFVPVSLTVHYLPVLAGKSNWLSSSLSKDKRSKL